KGEEYVKAENISDFVEFRGPVNGKEKAEILEAADIFVFPTYYEMEGHPWVIVEAMAAGLPVITTDQGCIKESVCDGENGFIVSKKDSGILGQRINYLIENPEKRKRMGKKSRQIYEQNFTGEHFIGRMISVINLILGR
ncbi:MAG: glycosyltransferase, partial [Candidatus Aminicenantales bacterium]